MEDTNRMRIAFAGLAADLDVLSTRGHCPSPVRPEWIPEDLQPLIQAASVLSRGGSKSNPIRQVSIFDAVGKNRTAKTPRHLLPLRELKLSRDALFPQTTFKTDAASETKKICEALKKETAKLEGTSEEDVEKLLFALERICGSVPAFDPAVSLYDHARLTAAAALLLEECELPTGSLEKIAEGKADEAFLKTPMGVLIAADISGIQKFIYTISDKKAAQSLRGRSFFLQALTESILRFILRELNIPYTNVIYSGAGTFFILAPLSAKTKMPAIRARISRNLLKFFGTDLYCAVGVSDFAPEGFFPGKLETYWSGMYATLGRVKNRRYLELGESLHESLFVPAEHGGNEEDLCGICGAENPHTHAFGDIRSCPLCASFWDEYGSALPVTSYIRFQYGEPEWKPECEGNAADVLAAFGTAVDFWNKGQRASNTVTELEKPEHSLFWELNDGTSRSIEGAVYRRRYIATKIPPSFESMLDDAGESGIPRIGVLRMDVDNMGSVFMRGFGNDLSLSRLSSLSSQMSHFFEGYIREITRDERIYTVYTGGDDVFLLGPWQMMTEIAETIRNDFREYACGNPELTISGGLTFIQNKYPIRQAAADAGEAEEQAKNYKNGAHEKDAFSFLGEAWSWEEFKTLRTCKDRLKKIVGEQNGPKALLQLLQRLDEQKQDSDNKTYGRWLWMGDYQFARMERQYRNDLPLKEGIEELHKSVREGYYQNIHLWGRAARWAQLELRITE